MFPDTNLEEENGTGFYALDLKQNLGLRHEIVKTEREPFVFSFCFHSCILNIKKANPLCFLNHRIVFLQI